MHCGYAFILLFLNIGKGDEVIIAQTRRNSSCCRTSGLNLFVDSEYPTGNINISLIEKKLQKTKAITVVHYLGNPVDVKKLKLLARKYKLYLLEDCALALELQ